MRIDLVRGWLQLTIFASHAAGSRIGAWLIHGAWSLSDSTKQFVVLSGFMLGSVFARKSIRPGWRAASWDVLLRAGRLCRTQLLVCALSWGVTVAFRLWPSAWWLDPLLLFIGYGTLLLFAQSLDRQPHGVSGVPAAVRS